MRAKITIGETELGFHEAKIGLLTRSQLGERRHNLEARGLMNDSV